jgi:hypothetical protein
MYKIAVVMRAHGMYYIAVVMRAHGMVWYGIFSEFEYVIRKIYMRYINQHTE